MVSFLRRKKSEPSSESLLPSTKKSSFFGKKAPRSEDTYSLPSNSRFPSIRRRKWEDIQVPEYETPPPSPLYSDGQESSPLQVTVLATRSSPATVPVERDNQSLSNTTISDLSGSMIIASPRKKGDYRPVSPYSEIPTSVEQQTETTASPQDVTEKPHPPVLCAQDSATDMVSSIIGYVVDEGCKRNEDETPELMSMDTPTVTNKDDGRHEWGTAPSMSFEDTTLEGTGQGTQTTTNSSFARMINRGTDGSICTAPEPRHTGRLRASDDTRSSAEKSENHHDNFELVLEDDNSFGSAKRRWLPGGGRSKTTMSLQDTPKRSTAGWSWRRNPTLDNGQDIPVSEFTITTDENELSVTSDMDQEERYKAVFGVDPDAQNKPESKKKKKVPPKRRKSPRRMLKAMSKRLSLTRGKQESKALVETPKVDAVEDYKKAAVTTALEVEEVDDCNDSYLQLTIENLGEEELLGEELVEDEKEEDGSKKAVEEGGKKNAQERTKSPFDAPDDEKLPYISEEVEKALSKDEDDPLAIKTTRSRSWGMSGRPGSPFTKSASEVNPDAKEPKSLSRTLSNPLRKLSANFSKKEKPPPKIEKPEWKAVEDPSTGKTYYYHRVTRKTSWTKPSEYDEQMDAYERAKMQGESVKPARKSRFGRSFDMSAEQQKRLEEGMQPKSRKRSLTSVLRKKSSRDFNRDVWATKQEIARLLKVMSPNDVQRVEELMKKHEGNEQGLLLSLRALAESQPFDEPLEVDDSKDTEEEKKDDSTGVVLRSVTGVTSSTGGTGISGMSSRVRSGRTAFTSLTDTTQKVKNTNKQLNNGFSVISELNTSAATSLSSMDGIGKSTPSPEVHVTETPTRERELRVEEFESGRYDHKRAEVFDTKAPLRLRQRNLPKKQEPEELSSALEEDTDDPDSIETDSVSELGHSDAEFQRQKHRYDLARRMALDDAIRNRDWELAANVTENIRGRSFDSKSSSISYHTWTQSELDQFISDNDWDAVATYIAYMRDKNDTDRDSPAGYDIPHMHDRNPPKKTSRGRSDNTRDPEPRREEAEPLETEAMQGPQKRFGAKSQLQHSGAKSPVQHQGVKQLQQRDSELVSIASSWDSVYRTDSSDESFYTSSESSSFDYRRRQMRRMAT